MDGILEDPLTVAGGGYEFNPSFVESISSLFTNLMDLAQGKVIDEDGEIVVRLKQAAAVATGNLSVGCFLRQGLNAYVMDWIGSFIFILFNCACISGLAQAL
ncbi:probable polyamine oxidase 5 [Olea europaea subsp. europaea]|uniref:Probable polyamine oxidase 5 n=1 Tax=Olea europaea subsp. europaea TaxID=158383 RepID=A0A8S0TZJ5_OLEEU|nr:probable polyamine oxidase 5 [Olea europaea subsp. europaea]